MNLITAPSLDQFEFSLFGPGRGECIILHLGDGVWAVIDSCVSAGRRESVALDYLRAIGAMPNQIVLVVATHWHDDHTRGLSSVMRVADQARFATSAAFKVDEFAKLIASADPLHRRSGVDEFASIVAVLRDRRRAGLPAGLSEPMWTFPGRALVELRGTSRSFPVAIRSMSPSDASVRAAFEEISAALPRESTPVGVVPHRSPNAASIVLWVTAGDTRLLLGADLERTTRMGEGWTAILEQHDGVAAHTLKVPHHGSENADSPEMWSVMLSQEPIAAVAPYSSGVTPLPSSDDLRRLRSRTPQVYCTANPRGSSPGRRDTFIDKQLKQRTKSRRIVSAQCGQIRVRWRPTDATIAPTIELFSGAYRTSAA